MASQQDRKSSKFMSLVLRHAPGHLGVTPDANGWVPVETLIAASEGTLTRQSVDRIVANSDKRRFAFSADGQNIRANQGHSFPVDLGLVPQTPPQILTHGTHEARVEMILAEGLKPMGRQYVHLSKDVDTARAVGKRRGPPVVLNVAAGKMHGAGHLFWLSVNGVWLTDHVPPEYLTVTA